MASRRESKTAFVFYGGGSLGAVEVGMRRRSGASSSDLAQETCGKRSAHEPSEPATTFRDADPTLTRAILAPG